jgi:hypothetical protein
MIKNLNASYGEPIIFNNIEEMAAAIRDCGYELPDSGLMEGIDYEQVKTCQCGAPPAEPTDVVPYEHEDDCCQQADHDMPPADLKYLYTRIGGRVRRQCAVPSYLDDRRLIICDIGDADEKVIDGLQRAGLRKVRPGERCEIRFRTDAGQHETE